MLLVPLKIEKVGEEESGTREGFSRRGNDSNDLVVLLGTI
jgi:hypothetical protein